MARRKLLRKEPRGLDPLESRGLTPSITRQFCRLIREGLPTDGVLDYLGVDSASFHMWKRRGQKYLDRGYPAKWKKYAIFLRNFRRALAQWRLDRIRSMQTAGRFWTREMTLLERRDRRNFSRWEQPGGTEDDYDPDERFL